MADAAKRYTYRKADGFEVWGKQYESLAGEATWRIRVFSDQDRRVQTYDTVTEDLLPSGTRAGESKAIKDAIAAWTNAGPPAH